jgi:hypothetical protein
MSTSDLVLALLQAAMTVVCLALGTWLLAGNRRRPGRVRMFRRPVRNPLVMAAAYFSFGVGFAADATAGFAGHHAVLTVLSLLGKVAALVFFVINATRRTA